MDSWSSLEKILAGALAWIIVFQAWVVRTIFTNSRKIAVIEEHKDATDKKLDKLESSLEKHADEMRTGMKEIRTDIKTMMQDHHRS